MLVQMTFSGENDYVGHTSKNNNLWFLMTGSTPARWLTAPQNIQEVQLT